MLISPVSHFDQNSTTALDTYADHRLLTGRFEQHYSSKERLCNLSLIACFAGRIALRVNEHRLSIDQDSFLVVSQGSLVSFSTESLPCEPLILSFRTVVADVVAAELFHKQTPDTVQGSVEALKNHELIAHIHYIQATLTERLRLLVSLGASCASFHAIKADALVRSILADLTEENHKALALSEQIPVVKQSTRADLYKRLTVSKNWMDRHFHDTIDIEACAAVAMMNKEHFLRSFKMVFGLTPYQYLIQVRMDWARWQLVTTEKPVQTISEQIGFETLSSFSYQFKKVTGMSPSDFRRNSDYVGS